MIDNFFFVLRIIAITFSIIIIFILVLPITNSTRLESRKRACLSNLKEIGTAVELYYMKVGREQEYPYPFEKEESGSSFSNPDATENANKKD